MWLLPVSLVLVSAALHAGWNLIVKGEDDKLLGAWGTVVTAPVILSPFLLIVMRMMPVSYIAALREISVVFGALLGWRVLGEGFGGRRLWASLTVGAGLIVLSLTARS